MSELLESRWQDTRAALLEGLQGTKKSVMATTLKIQESIYLKVQPLEVQQPVILLP